MKAQNISQQMFGDVNKKLNYMRAQMNEEVREKCFEILDKKKEQNQGDVNGS